MATIIGTSGNNTLSGTSGSDVIFGLAGNDTISAGAGNDLIDAGAGNDTVNAGTGNDIIYGGAGADILNGNSGNDLVFGGDSTDTLIYTLSENSSGTIDFYDGGSSSLDKLELRVTQAQYNSFQSQILTYNNLLLHPELDSSFIFNFGGTYLVVTNLEKLNVVITDTPPVDITAPNTTNVTTTGLEDAASITINLAGTDNSGIVTSFNIDSLANLNGTLYTDALLTNAVIAGGNYAASGNALTLYYVPATNFNGAATFTYAAKDAAGNVDSSPATATITVTAVNDSPVLTLPSHPGYTDSAAADTFPVFQGTMIATDPDSPSQTFGVNGGISSNETGFNLIKAGVYGDLYVNSGSGVFKYVPNALAINVLQVGTNPTDSFTLTVNDGAGGSDSEVFAINIIGANDAPVITSNGGGATAAISIPENSTAVTTVTATDVDTSLGSLTYSLSGADSSKFTINNTGVLSFITAPNFEAPTDAGGNNIYDVTVQVSDGSLTDAQAITVAVMNVVDNQVPALASIPAVFYTDTAAADSFNAITRQMNASDPDAGPASLTYGLTGSNADNSLAGYNLSLAGNYGKLYVNSNTGAYTYVPINTAVNALVASAAALDSFTMTVSDGADSVSTTFNVNLLGANDAPIITSDGGVDIAAPIPENNIFVVTTVTATDADIPLDSLTYSLSGADAAFFSLGGVSGNELSFTAADFENPQDTGGNNVYDVTVNVSDGTLTDSQNIAVTVINVIGTQNLFTASDDNVNFNTASIDPDVINPASYYDASTGNDTVTLPSLATALAISYDFSQTFHGGDDNDLIFSGNGNDIIAGDGGTDTVSYATSTAGVTVSLALQGASQNTISTGLDTLFNFENLTGSNFSDTLTGDTNSNTINGGSGNDTIDGGAGNDTLNGGVGTDTVSYASAGAGVTVSLATGFPQNTGGAGSDTLSNFENLTGSQFGDILTGTTGANTINGGAGNDTISGNGGNGDNLIGGMGVDNLTGGVGAEQFRYNSPSESASFVNSGTGADTINGFNAVSDELWFFAGPGGFVNIGPSGFDTVTGGNINSASNNARFIYDSTNDKLYYDADGGSHILNSSDTQLIINFNGIQTESDFTASDIHFF